MYMIHFYFSLAEELSQVQQIVRLGNEAAAARLARVALYGRRSCLDINIDRFLEQVLEAAVVCAQDIA